MRMWKQCEGPFTRGDCENEDDVCANSYLMQIATKIFQVWRHFRVCLRFAVNVALRVKAHLY